MSEQAKEETAEQFWRDWAETGHHEKEHRAHRLMALLPSEPRCRFCNAPFGGIGSHVVRLLYRKQPSSMNPLYCNVCEQFARNFQGGAEVHLAMLFADIRGSTAISESMSPGDFSKLINRFYVAASRTIIPTLAAIDKLIGDEVAAYFFPGASGPDYIRVAVETALNLLRETGHDDPGGPWVPVGAGVHHGLAYFGAVGTKEGVVDITALGDSVNTAARLASKAGIGEVLVSEAAVEKAGLEADHLEQRHLELKGISEALAVRVFRVDSA
jgi:adenylate cyclase